MARAMSNMETFLRWNLWLVRLSLTVTKAPWAVETVPFLYGCVPSLFSFAERWWKAGCSRMTSQSKSEWRQDLVCQCVPHGPAHHHCNARDEGANKHCDFGGAEM